MKARNIQKRETEPLAPEPVAKRKKELNPVRDQVRGLRLSGEGLDPWFALFCMSGSEPTAFLRPANACISRGALSPVRSHAASPFARLTAAQRRSCELTYIVVARRSRKRRDRSLFVVPLAAKVPCRISANSKKGEHGASTSPGAEIDLRVRERLLSSFRRFLGSPAEGREVAG